MAGLTPPATGVVPGGGIAPVRATIGRPHGLEAWCEREVEPRVQGRSVLTRVVEDGVRGGELAAAAPKSMGR
jgi:hypothetical protein